MEERERRDLEERERERRDLEERERRDLEEREKRFGEVVPEKPLLSITTSGTDLS